METEELKPLQVEEGNCLVQFMEVAKRSHHKTCFICVC